MTRPGEGVVGIDGNSEVGYDGSKLDRSRIGNNEVNNEGDNEIRKKNRKNMFKSKKTKSGFFTSRSRMALIKLRQVFIKAPILYHFDPKYYIRVEMDASSYAIGVVLSQLNLDNLGQKHLVAFFLQKTNLTEIRYETHDSKFLAIAEVFKTWRRYLEGFQHKILMLIDYNNLCQFIDIKNPSSRQVC